MEKLSNSFTVHRPVDDAWAVLTDLARIAPCMPGAELHEIDGELYKGAVKVKLGSIVTNFKGQASFTERDDAAHRASLSAEGRDTGGKGAARATISARLEATSPGTSTCTVDTELHVSGKVATFGRGIMADVSKKLMAQFAANLNEMLDSAPAAPAATAAPAPAPAPAPAAPPKPAPVEATPIDLGEVAGAAVMKRVLPLVGGLGLVWLLIRRLRRR